ncbi:HBR497Cp [Eremothecium sinecaudum]|uniref:HBR497Cp n=1 Tax=Eremothecium sinecaudum TaxID=45286 RepID=A0A109UXL0_9SACH|nr:HBR497Cp [Eremothecium sinecaudum]AMD19398.1 HBR497Cp [Eremothecium sinecaudum]
MTGVTKICPNCKETLQKCLIQQNYGIVICPNEECMYPFNEAEAIDQIVQVNDKEILQAAKMRLRNDNTLYGNDGSKTS